MRWVIPLATFAIALLLYTSNNRFPYYYHPDEPSKVRQIESGSRNFHHPLLLLTATDLAVRLLRIQPRSQNVVIAGRWCAAIFAAIAAAGFSVIAFSYAGAAGAAWAGILVLLHQRLLELAHFMKEDTGLLMGVVLTLLAAHQFWRSPSRSRAAWLGCAAAVAVSAKYVGVVMLAAALPVLACRRPFSWSHVLVFSGTLLAVLVLINWSLIISPNEFRNALSGELAMLNQHAGVQLSFSHFDWVKGLLHETAIPLWIFVGYHLRTVWLTRACISMPEWILNRVPACVWVDNFNHQRAERSLLAASDDSDLSIRGFGHRRDVARRRQPVATGNCGGDRAQPFLRGISNGWRRAGISERLPSRAGQVDRGAPARERRYRRDQRVGLRSWDRMALTHDSQPLRQKIVSAPFAADVDTLAGLRKRGVTHVAITDSAYQRFMKTRATSTAGFEDAFARRRTFYKTLLSEGKIVWQRDGGKVGVLNPELRLCDITTLELPQPPSR